MARTGVTLQDILGAVSTLESNGERVTVLGVRGILGRGSSSTIARLLKQVRPSESMPNGLPREVETNSFLPGLGKVMNALREADAEARAMGEAINRQIAEAKVAVTAERESMNRDLDQVLAEAGEAREKAEELETRLTEQVKQTATLTAELQLFRKREAELETVRRLQEQHMDQLRDRLDRAEATTKDAQARLEAALAEAAEMRGRMAVLMEK